MRCRICTQDKLPTDFYKSSRHVCRDCRRSQVKDRALTNPAVQAYDRERSKTPARRALIAAASRQWRLDHPEGYRAQNAVNNAIRDGKLERKPCSMCGDPKVHGHHKDYSRPLDVVWLCAKCHHRIHATFPELGGHAHA